MTDLLEEYFQQSLFDFDFSPELTNKKSNITKKTDTNNRAGLIIKTSDGIIMGHTPNEIRDKNGWDLIKGHIEAGEDAKTAVVREAKEECGLDIDESKLIELGRNKYREGNITFFGYELPEFTYKDLASLDCTSMFVWYTDDQGKILPKGKLSKHTAEFKELDTFDIFEPSEVKTYMYQGLYNALTVKARIFIGDVTKIEDIFEPLYNSCN